jgi:hypothetical protein
MAQAMECLLNKHKAPTSKPSPAKTKKKKKTKTTIKKTKTKEFRINKK